MKGKMNTRSRRILIPFVLLGAMGLMLHGCAPLINTYHLRNRVDIIPDYSSYDLNYISVILTRTEIIILSASSVGRN